MLLLKILFFILSLIVGTCFLVYADPLVRTFGKTAWAEKHFQMQGGTYLLWKVIGIIIIILGFLFVVGGLDWLFFPK
jgi:Na+-driven multidrug efflux pump